MSEQGAERESVDLFEGVGKRRHDRKFRVKCLGPGCDGKMFDSESTHVRLCPKCTKRIKALRGGMG